MADIDTKIKAPKKNILLEENAKEPVYNIRMVR